MLTDLDVKFWGPSPEIVNWVSSFIDEGASVLEIGPGVTPFFRATHFVGWTAGKNIVPCDLNRDRLPFSDKQFDFIYCRHVLEDLYDPFHVCEEMSRVARAGYIETPSPLAEICRGIDGGSPNWRGYIHHRYFTWDANGVLTFMTKYPVIEHVDFENELSVEDTLRRDPLLWNTYFMWKDRIKWQHLQHEVNFRITHDYSARISDAVHQAIANAQRLRHVYAARS